jgi:hypothetical protein
MKFLIFSIFVNHICPSGSGSGIRIRNPNPESESGIRIWTPNPESESGIWIRNPNPESESGIRIRNPNPESESGIRIRNPNPESESDPESRIRIRIQIHWSDWIWIRNTVFLGGIIILAQIIEKNAVVKWENLVKKSKWRLISSQC